MSARNKREKQRTRALVDGLNEIADRLRAGESLRQALVRTAGGSGSPFYPVASSLLDGRPLAGALHAGAVGHDDADVASALCVLAVHAEAGGDPLPACRALAERIARRAAARDEARALTTQSRLGARTILLLTPAFLALVALSDPRSAIASFAQPRTRAAISAGIVLQVIGGAWVGAIVSNVAASGSRVARVPVLRALRAMFVGRVRETADLDVASCADTVALASRAGLSATAAMSAAAPYARGAFGEAVREATLAVTLPLHEAVTSSISELTGDGPTRFARALTASIELGVPLAPALAGLADDLYSRSSLQLAEDVRRASIRVLVPLGVVVLPAFVLACLVPLFVGGLEQIAG